MHANRMFTNEAFPRLSKQINVIYDDDPRSHAPVLKLVFPGAGKGLHPGDDGCVNGVH